MKPTKTKKPLSEEQREALEKRVRARLEFAFKEKKRPLQFKEVSASLSSTLKRFENETAQTFLYAMHAKNLLFVVPTLGGYKWIYPIAETERLGAGICIVDAEQRTQTKLSRLGKKRYAKKLIKQKERKPKHEHCRTCGGKRLKGSCVTTPRNFTELARQSRVLSRRGLAKKAQDLRNDQDFNSRHTKNGETDQ